MKEREQESLLDTYPAPLKFLFDSFFEFPILGWTKGFFDLADRQKHLLVRQQNPDIDIRFLFVNANNKLKKRIKITINSNNIIG